MCVIAERPTRSANALIARPSGGSASSTSPPETALKPYVSIWRRCAAIRTRGSAMARMTSTTPAARNSTPMAKTTVMKLGLDPHDPTHDQPADQHQHGCQHDQELTGSGVEQRIQVARIEQLDYRDQRGRDQRHDPARTARLCREGPQFAVEFGAGANRLGDAVEHL